MAFKVADRVQETTNSPGTAAATLLGAVTGYQSFSSGIGANNTTFYVIADQTGTNWEVGLGALNSTATALTRTTVYSSSNGGALVNFATGTQNVWCDYPASTAVIQGQAVNFSSIGAVTPGTGAFTTLAASSTISGAGFTAYLASPPSIGNTAPNSGAFTTLSASSTVIGSTSFSYSANNTQIGQQGIANNAVNAFNINLNKPNNDPQPAYQVFFWNNSLAGYITYAGGGIAYVSSSDARLKENVTPASDVLNIVNSIKVRSYDWIDSGKHDDYGFVAQELNEVCPFAVTEQANKEDGSIDMPWGVDYSKLVPMLTKAIQELNAKVTALEAQLGAK